MSIGAGAFDQRVAFKRRSVTQDSFGADVLGSPSTVGTFWARVQYLRGKELQYAQQRWAEAQYIITMRRQPGVTILPTDYAEWNDQTLDIMPVMGPGTRDCEWIVYAKDHVE
jgi:head-tail adaptor